jgi:hypothetical protein
MLMKQYLFISFVVLVSAPVPETALGHPHVVIGHPVENNSPRIEAFIITSPEQSQE